MRGLGIGQKIHVYIIPEVQELMKRELKSAVITNTKRNDDHVLEDISAWLIVNSLRSEQTQWTMLCLQNISNLYRKNAFRCLRKSIDYYVQGSFLENDSLTTETDANTNIDTYKSDADASSKLPLKVYVTSDIAKERREHFIEHLNKNDALALFDESIDFSLEAGVPDPRPFDAKLTDLLTENAAFLQEDQMDIGKR